MSKIKERNRKKAALTDRKSAASQARMKNIASLAADDRVAPKKRRKNGGGVSLSTLSSHCLTHLGSSRGYVRSRRCGLGHISQDREFLHARFQGHCSNMTASRITQQPPRTKKKTSISSNRWNKSSSPTTRHSTTVTPTPLSPPRSPHLSRPSSRSTRTATLKVI